MKPLIVAILALAPGGLLVLAVLYWRQRRFEQARRHAEALIRPPQQRFGKLTDDELQTVRASADRRRHAAEDKRRDAARIVSGQSAEDRLRIVRGHR
jgi:hypothetical protein